MLRRHGRSEEGATAVLVAICLLMIFGAGAVAVDLGSAWETKRDFVVDTDAAALAGANALAEPGGDCPAAEGAAAAFLSANLGETVTPAELKSGVGASLVCDSGSGRVTVGWTGEAQQTLSGALGDESLDVFASSTAQVATTAGGGGLRPVAACLFDAEIQAWLAGGEGTTYRFDLNGAPTSCGGAPGNWGWTCFDRDHGPYVSDGPTGCDGNNGQTRIESMLEHGYSGDVDLGDPPPAPPVTDDEDCIPATPATDWCDGKPGSLGASMNATLQGLVDSGLEFPILGIYDYTGNGANAATAPAAFIGVRLVDFKISGKNADRFLEFELRSILLDGTSTVQTSGQLTTTTAVLCGADAVGDFCD